MDAVVQNVTHNITVFGVTIGTDTLSTTLVIAFGALLAFTVLLAKKQPRWFTWILDKLWHLMGCYEDYSEAQKEDK